MTTQPEALRLANYWSRRADELQTWVDENDYVEFGYRPEGLKKEQDGQRKTAAELRRLHEEVMLLRGDPGNRYAHRLAIELECALLAPEQINVDLLDEYHTAVRVWMEANGQPYVSGFGKD